MIIGIDLDGVVFDTEEYYRAYSSIYDSEVSHFGLKDTTEMDCHIRYGWDNKTADEFYGKYTSEVLNNAPVKPGAKFVLNKLKEMGHKLVCITLRGYYRDCEIEITEKRLKEEGISFDKIIYKQTDKANACKEEGVQIMIDDNHNHVKRLSGKGITCLHFRGAGLKKVEQENVIEIQNWGDIYSNLLKIFKNN